MSAPPRASRRAGGLNADYYNPPDQYFYPDDPRLYGPGAPPRSPRQPYEDTPPTRPHRRHKSEHRRPPSPEYEEPYEKPSRRRSRRVEPEIVNYPSHGRQYSVPEVVPPPYAPEPERVRRHDRPRDYERPPRRHDRSSMPPPAREPYDAHVAPGYATDRRRPPKTYRGDPEARPSRRSRQSSPPPAPAGRPRVYDRPEPRSGGRRHRDHHSDEEYGPPPPRRARSQGRVRREPSASPPPRGRAAPKGHERPRGGHKAPPARRQSVPASSKPKNDGTPWWQNPMVQAGARYALTAGAQAAFRSRDDKGPWLGQKGAKVAGAALSAALVDGIIGQKHNNSVRQELLRTGANAAMNDIEQGKYPAMASSSSSRRRR